MDNNNFLLILVLILLFVFAFRFFNIEEFDWEVQYKDNCTCSDILSEHRCSGCKNCGWSISNNQGLCLDANTSGEYLGCPAEKKNYDEWEYAGKYNVQDSKANPWTVQIQRTYQSGPTTLYTADGQTVTTDIKGCPKYILKKKMDDDSYNNE